MSNIEPCFVPSYIDSNTSDEEFLNIARDCLPAAFVARMEAMQDEADDTAILVDIGKAQRALEAMREIIGNEFDEVPSPSASFSSVVEFVGSLPDKIEKLGGELKSAERALEEYCS